MRKIARKVLGMSKQKAYALLALTGLVVWFAETAVFGWNSKAQSGPEHMLDTLSVVLIAWGIIGNLLNNLEIHKHEHQHDNIDHQNRYDLTISAAKLSDILTGKDREGPDTSKRKRKKA